MIGEIWWRLLCLPVIVVVAFGLFCPVLIVALIGYVDPGSSPRDELLRLATLTNTVARYLRGP